MNDLSLSVSKTIEEARANHEGGWSNILEMLDETLCVSVIA